MPRINLLPIKAVARRASARNELFLMLVLVGGTLLSLFSWYGSVDGDTSALKAKNAALDSEIGKLTEEVKKVEDLQAKEKKVQKKL